MGFQEKQLGQLRPASTTATSLYSPGVGITAIIKSIVVCNTTAGDATAQIFIDDNGSTYSEETALFYNMPIDGNTTTQIDTYYPMSVDAGNIAVRSSVSSALTFTIFGAEVS